MESYMWLLVHRMFSRPIHVTAHTSTSFFAVVKYYSIVWLKCILYFHSSVNKYYCFCFSIITNNTALTCVLIFDVDMFSIPLGINCSDSFVLFCLFGSTGDWLQGLITELQNPGPVFETESCKITQARIMGMHHHTQLSLVI